MIRAQSGQSPNKLEYRAEVLSRAGKATGKNKDLIIVRFTSLDWVAGQESCVDLNEKLALWGIESSEEVFISDANSCDFDGAKQK